MEDVRVTDDYYLARKVKQEDVSMQSASRICSPAHVKSEHVNTYDDGSDSEEVKDKREVRRAEERHFWRASYNR